MGNKVAFITLGMDMKPNYTTYDAVVSFFFFLPDLKNALFHFYFARLRIARPGFEPWLGTLCWVLGQDTTLTVPLSTQVYKWGTGEFNAGDNTAMD